MAVATTKPLVGRQSAGVFYFVVNNFRNLIKSSHSNIRPVALCYAPELGTYGCTLCCKGRATAFWVLIAAFWMLWRFFMLLFFGCFLLLDHRKSMSIFRRQQKIFLLYMICLASRSLVVLTILFVLVRTFPIKSFSQTLSSCSFALNHSSKWIPDCIEFYELRNEKLL